MMHSRRTSGIRTANVTPKTDKVVAGMVLADREGELVAISKQSQVIRVALAEIAVSGRSTQGSRIMKLRPGDSIASLTAL